MSNQLDPRRVSEFPNVPGYEVLELIARGGMGRVYRGIDRRLGREVAIKCLIDTYDDSTRRRFTEEAKAVSLLQHPNIAQLYEFDAENSPPYFAMELVAGGTLGDLINARPVAPQVAARIIATLGRAIHFAHQRHTIHRDLKPSNVLVSQTDSPHLLSDSKQQQSFDPSRLRIADFGLAKSTTVDTDLTQTGEIVGTACYMSPEQATGIVSKIGPTTDIYALGAMLYELLTGRPPFVAPDNVQTIMLLLSEDPIAPCILVPKTPKDLQTICLKCIEKKTTHRYSSALALAEDLERYLRDEPILAKPTSLVTRSGKWVKRRPWQSAFIALIGLSLIGLSIALAVVQNGKQLLAAANRKQELSFKISQETLSTVVNRIRDELYEIPGAGKLTLQTVRDSVAMHRRLLDIEPDSMDVIKELAKALEICRLTEWNLREFEASNATYGTLTKLLDENRLAHPEDSFFEYESLRLALEYAADDISDDEYGQLKLRLERLLTLWARDPNVLKLASSFERSEVNRAALRGDHESILEHSAKRVQYSRQFFDAVDSSGKISATFWLVQALIAQAENSIALNELPKANAGVSEASDMLNTLDSVAENETGALGLKSRTLEVQGIIRQHESEFEAAAELYSQSISITKRLIDEFPAEASRLSGLAQTQLRYAAVRFQSDQSLEARSSLKQAEINIEKLLKDQPSDYLGLQLKAQAAALRDMFPASTPQAVGP